MRTMFKKAVSVLLATAVIVSGAAVANSSTASAAKSASVTARVYFAGVQGKEDCKWIAGDGKTAKNLTKTVKITKGKKTNVSLTVKNSGKKIDGATVFTVDLENIFKSFKSVKISNVSVKADGKKKSVKVVQGKFEPKTKPNNYRLSIYNKWGNNGDNSTKVNKSKNYAFKKTLTVSFTVVAK